MNLYFVIQSLCIVIIYTVHPASTGNYIDMFIENLISSQKFDMLVEKIADRAVKKIKIQQGQGNNPKRGDNDKEISKRGESNEALEFRPNILGNEEANEKFKITKSQQKARSGKIDNEAVNDKFRAVPLDKLSLKYKSFTNSKPQDSESYNREKPVQQHEHQSLRFNKQQNKFIDQQYKSMQQNKHNEQQNKYDLPDRPEKQELEYNPSNEVKKLSDFDLNDERSKKANEILRPVVIKEDSESPPIISDSAEPISKAPILQFSDNILNIQDQPNKRTQDKGKLNLKAGNKHIMPESLNNFRANENASEDDQSNEVIYNESEHNEYDKVEQSPSLDEEEDDKKAQTVKSNVVIRREGDKLYTFVKSPDYKEYHMNYEKDHIKQNNSALLTFK